MSNKDDTMTSMNDGDDGGKGEAVVATTPTTSSTPDLMASLLGNNNDGGLFGNNDTIDKNVNGNNTIGGGGGGGGGGSLFGDDDDDDQEPPPFATTTLAGDQVVPSVVPPNPVATTAPTTTSNNNATTTSLLMQSGLLPTSNGGGLFDDVDQQQAEAEAKKQQQQLLLQAQAEEAARQQQQQQAAEKAQEELQRQQQQQQQQQLQQQQLTDQMQSVYLGNTIAPSQQQQLPPQPNTGRYGMAQSMPPMTTYATAATHNNNNIAMPGQQPQQPQQQQQQQPYGSPASGGTQSYAMPSPPAPVQAGFYRDEGHLQHDTGVGTQSAYLMNPQQQQQQQQQQQRYYQPTASPSVLAGMHNGPAAQQAVLGRPPASLQHVTAPPVVPTMYQMVHVSEPLLIPGQALFGAAPHWSYQIATSLQPPPGNNNNSTHNGPVWLVRRRFRHVVALEDRLREECPGAILAPRPDKHAARALEEASAQQSAEFAVQRANELQVYLNQLIAHPIAHAAHALRLFLSLQDDLGTAWPEVSNNAFTRLANAGVGAAVKVSEQTQATKFPWQDPIVDDYGEEDAQLMALASQEQVRMAAVLQAVPKLEGAVTLLREGAELRGATGMELGRLAKEVESADKELSYPMELVSGGMLRGGRRSKRMALELAAAMETFVQQYKLCRYEKMAFTDRRIAIMRRTKERGRADHRAQQLMMQHQRQMYQPQNPYGGGGGGVNNNPYGNHPNNVHFMQNQAINADTLASDAVQECNEIGRRVKSEVNRIAWNRRQEWKAAVKVVASASKEAITENVAIWESVRESFLQAFPGE